jgi:hypothetical protein
MTNETNEYHERYNSACSSLMAAAQQMKSDLEVIDVSGAYFAVGVEYLKQAGVTDEDIGEYLHDLASAVETGEVGFKKRLN